MYHKTFANMNHPNNTEKCTDLIYVFLNTRTRQKQHIAQLSMPTHALGILLPKINQTRVFSFVFETQHEKNRLRMLQNYQVAFQSCVRGHP